MKFVWRIIVLYFIPAVSITGSWTTDELGVVADSKADAGTLVLVHALWRHGDRTPSYIFPTDIQNPASSWKLGLGELTAEGVAQQYRLGRWLRKRYDSFLGQEFSPSEVYIRSSDFNRTLMSAQANMAGLFPLRANQSWIKDLPWQPIPVHTVRKENDPELHEAIECAEADIEKNRIFEENEDVLKIERENAAMLELIGEKTQITKGRFRLGDMWYVFDPLNAEYHHNQTHKMPEWVNATVWSEILRLYDISCQFCFATEKIRRLRGGMLLKEIISRMEKKAKNVTTFRGKFVGYSAHDMTVASLLSVFGVCPTVFPLYASVVLLELHYRNGSFSVELYYKNVTDGDQVYKFPIEGCGEICTLEQFLSRSRRYLPDDWWKECSASNWIADSLTGSLLFFLLTALMFGGILISIVMKKIYEKQELYAGRMLLPTSDCESNLKSRDVT